MDCWFKWRRVAKAPTVEKWYCSDNLDAEHRVCSVPQEISDAAIDRELSQIQAAALSRERTAPRPEQYGIGALRLLNASLVTAIATTSIPLAGQIDRNTTSRRSSQASKTVPQLRAELRIELAAANGSATVHFEPGSSANKHIKHTRAGTTMAASIKYLVASCSQADQTCFAAFF